MLQQLRISNYALIQELDIVFDKGFSVITGETGAGKSILLGALGLVLGNRSDTQVLMDKTKKCIVEALFDVSGLELQWFFEAHELDGGGECIMRREISPNGKSRAFINDSPVNLKQMRELGRFLVDIHSQHESLQLSEASFQLQVLDNLADNQLEKNDYEAVYTKYNQLIRKIENLQAEAARKKAEEDFTRFQYEELEKANLISGEYALLESRLTTLKHAGEIAGGLYQAAQLLDDSEGAILDKLNELQSVMQKLRQYLPSAAELTERCESSLIELKDIAGELKDLETETQFDPDEIEQAVQRLDLLNHLIHKHHLTTGDELITLRERFCTQLNEIEHMGEALETLEKEAKILFNQLEQKGKALSLTRQKAAPRLEKSVIEILQSLGMPHAAFKVHNEKKAQAGPDGYDRVQYLFSANKGGRPENMAEIASGGEMSRLMLAIKSLISQTKLLPTIIFDEIDTGVSGEIAGKVGRIMLAMSKKMQLISITHLPQIAGKANQHYLVYKREDDTRTTSMISRLDDERRLEEIAGMLSDDVPTAASRQAAKELLTK